MFTRFQSPLLGTALVVAAMALVAVPLTRLTASSDRVIPTAEPTEPATADRVSGSLRIRTLDPLLHLEITAPGGEVMVHMESLEPGEREVDLALPWQAGRVELKLVAGTGGKETAVFLTVLPDGYEGRTAFAIGSDRIEEELTFEWHP